MSLIVAGGVWDFEAGFISDGLISLGALPLTKDLSGQTEFPAAVRGLRGAWGKEEDYLSMRRRSSFRPGTDVMLRCKSCSQEAARDPHLLSATK